MFNNVTLVALSRLYGWGSASKAGKAAGKKWQARLTEAFQFTSVCVCLFFVHFALMKLNTPIGVEYINEYSFNFKWTVFCGYDAFAVSLHLYRTTLQHHLQ